MLAVLWRVSLLAVRVLRQDMKMLLHDAMERVSLWDVRMLTQDVTNPLLMDLAPVFHLPQTTNKKGTVTETRAMDHTTPCVIVTSHAYTSIPRLDNQPEPSFLHQSCLCIKH